MVTVEHYFSGIINFVFMLLGLLNTLLGGYLTHKYVHMEAFVDPIVWIIPSLILLFGVLTVILALLGCSGMAIENKPCSVTYFCLQILFILSEIAIGGYWMWRTENIADLVNTQSTFGAYSMDHNMEWTQMQTELNCCGSTGPYDYQRLNYSLPKECCISEPSLSTYRLLVTVFDGACEAAYVHKRGCNAVFAESLQEERIWIGAFLLGGALVKIIMLVVSFVIPFEELTEEIGWSPIGSLVWAKNNVEQAKTTTDV